MDIQVEGKVYQCFLGDNGTLDTVIQVNGEDFIFGDTSYYRDFTGDMTDEGFIELCHECIEDMY